MAEFKDAIPAAGGQIEFLFDPQRGLSTRISGSGFRAMYMVAVSMDGRRLLAEVPAAGLGQVMVYPQPSVLTYMQSDEQGLWGRNCPVCQKYFRTNHIMGPTFCPYCSRPESGLAFVTKEQSKYIIAYYDAFMRAYTGGVSTTLSMSDITDQSSAWHYSEEKQQVHFKCETKDCHTETDILGRYGFCPRCGKTNARTLFSGFIDRTLARWTEADKNVDDRHQRGEVWEDMTVKCLSEFEALAKHLRQRLLCFPMTANRMKEVEALNFQRPLETDEPLRQWFDIGVLRWNGNGTKPSRAIPQDDLPFIRKMIQRRHILMHNGGVVDQDYLDLSGDTQARLGERIRIRSNEAKRFVEVVRELGLNLLDQCAGWFHGGMMIDETKLSYQRGTLVEFRLHLGGGSRMCRGLVLNTAVLMGKGARQVWILDIDNPTPELEAQWTKKKFIVPENDITCIIPQVVIGGDTLLRDNPVSYPVRDLEGEHETPAAEVIVPLPAPPVRPTQK